MSIRGVTRNPGYKAGSHWAVCDSCGFVFRAEDLRETWDNRWVCRDDYEPRHPQDFLRVKKEQISVSQPIRPDDTSNFGGINFCMSGAMSGVAEAGCAIAGTQVIPSGTFDNSL